MTITTDFDRLMDKFTVGDDCWIWHAAADQLGYGRILWDGKIMLAHRVVYEYFVEVIPDGLHIDHLCRVPACVRPSHLEPVTQQENNRRQKAARTHCPQGHERIPENLRLHHGSLECAACHRNRERSRRKAVKS